MQRARIPPFGYSEVEVGWPVPVNSNATEKVEVA
jgi:hypothetical protein